MGKGKKKKNRHGPAELLIVEAEEFPTAVIVELWGRNAKGKREFLDSRRYDTPGRRTGRRAGARRRELTEDSHVSAAA